MRKLSCNIIGKGFFILAVSLILAAGLYPQTVQAASAKPAITSCKIDSTKKKVVVKAKIPKKTSAMGKKLYLIELDGYTSVPKTTKLKPVASTKAKKGTVTFKTTLNNGKKTSKLYSKFVVAYKSGSKYKIITDASYITNPEKLATYKSSYPKTYSKKGLQSENMEDAITLGSQYTVLNWTLNSIMAPGGLGYSYKGKMYYFNYNLLNYYDQVVHEYNEAGSKVTVILLLHNVQRSDLNSIMFKGSSALYSGINVGTKAGSEQFEAIMTFLAQRYGQKSHLVSGWILGNEIGNTAQWNYGGKKSLSSYMNNYVRSFRICQTAVTSVNKNAHVYVSLDQNWNYDPDGSGKVYFSGKKILDTFYSKLKAQGLVDWYLAYHAYPQGLTSPEFWDDDWTSLSTNSTIINFNNLSVLTNYIKKNYGKNVKVMLSEQSFSSAHGEMTQAAAYAYAYYISEANSMVEAFIYGRHIDNAGEIDPVTGKLIPWGLMSSDGTRREIWKVFYYIDSPDSTKVTNPLRSYISTLSKWSSISGFSSAKFAKMATKRVQLKNVTVTSTNYNKITISWTKASQATGYQIYRANSKNGTYKKIKTITSNSTTSYTNSGLTQGKTYYYKIRFYTKFLSGVTLYGNYSTKSGTTSVAPGNITSVTSDNGQVQVKWSGVSKETGYQIYRAASETGSYTKVYTAAAGTNTYTDANVKPGNVYYYKVRAYVQISGKTLYGEFSSANKVMVSAAIPQISEIRVGNQRVVLSWEQIAGATGYQIYASTSKNGTYTKIKTISTASTISYTKYRKNENGESGVEYFYKMRAYVKNDNGTAYSEYSNIYSATAYDKSMVITVSRNESDQPVINWPALEAVDGYQVERSISKTDGFVKLAELPADESTYIDTTAETATTYYYRVCVYERVSTGQLVYGLYSSVKSLNGLSDDADEADTVIEPGTETVPSTETAPSTEVTPSTETTPSTEVTPSTETPSTEGTTATETSPIRKDEQPTETEPPVEDD